MMHSEITYKHQADLLARDMDGERKLNHVDGTTAQTIFSSTVEKLILNDILVPVVSAIHLIALKLFAAQNNPDRLFKELSDIKEIFKVVKVNKEDAKKYFVKYGQEK